MKTALILCLAVLTLTVAGAQMPAVNIQSELTPAKPQPGDAIRISVTLNLPPRWHVNANPASLPELIPTKLVIADDPALKIERIVYPTAKTMTVPWAEAPVTLYSGKVEIVAEGRLTDQARSPLTVTGKLTYQACDDRVCFAPKTETINLQAELAIPAQPAVATPASAPPPADNAIARMLRQQGLGLTLVFLFASGLLLNLTPCVYPMIAITVSYFGGQGEQRSLGAAFARAAIYCAGIVLTYSTLGVVAALTGGLFGALLQSPWVLAGIGLLLVGMALSMFGLYELRPPAVLMQRAAGMSSTAGWVGMFLLGATVGIIAAPCLAPVVVVVLAFAGSSGDPWIGWWLFFALGCGLGVPYVLLGTFSGLLTKLPRSGVWMVKVKLVFGVLLLVVAAWITHPLWWSKPAKNELSVDQIRQQLAEARAAGRPVVMDFYADWCAPCKEMDKFTLPDPRVQEKLKAFVFVKVDLTAQTSPAAQQLMETYQVQGVPTYVFLGPDGQERTDCRQVGFVPAAEFVQLLDRALRPPGTDKKLAPAAPAVPPELLKNF